MNLQKFSIIFCYLIFHKLYLKNKNQQLKTGCNILNLLFDGFFTSEVQIAKLFFPFLTNVPATSIFFAFFVMIFCYRTEVVSEFVLSGTLSCQKYVCFLTTELCVQNTFHQLYIILGKNIFMCLNLAFLSHLY